MNAQLCLIKRIIFTYIFIIHSFHIYAQTPGWLWAVGTHSYPGISTGANSLSTDFNGNCYVLGDFQGYPFYLGNYYISLIAQGEEGFFAKIDSGGNVIWVNVLPNCGTSNITSDNLGNCYITGYYGGVNSYCAPGNDTLINAGYVDIYIEKIDTAGNFQWVKTAGGPGDDFPHGITSDNYGNIFVTGDFQDSIFIGNDTLICNCASNCKNSFLAKYNSAGDFIWARKVAGSGNSSAGVSIDDHDNCFITGEFQDTVVFNTDTLYGPHAANLFIAKYDSSGSFKWAKSNRLSQFSSAHGASCKAIASDKLGNSFITGFFTDTLFLDNDTVVGNLNHQVIFTAKYDSTGHIMWARGASAGNLANSGYAIAADENGNCVVTGQFTSTAHFGNDSIVSRGSREIFVVKYNSSGSLLWLKKAGGTLPDIGQGISSDNYGNTYVAGIAALTDTNTSATFDTIQLNSAQGLSMFVAKIGCNGIQPEIVFSNGILHSTTGVTFEWFYNGSLIHGATSQNYTPSQNGNYIVVSKDSDGCGSASIPYTVIGLGLNTFENNQSIIVYPNPSSGVFYFNSKENNPLLKIEIRNILGEKIYSTIGSKVDLSEYADGIYFYRVEVGEKIINGRLYKE